MTHAAKTRSDKKAAKIKLRTTELRVLGDALNKTASDITTLDNDVGSKT